MPEYETVGRATTVVPDYDGVARGVTSKTPDTSPLIEATADLDRRIEQMHELIGLLEDRLSPVLRLDPETADGRVGELRDPCSPHVDHLLRLIDNVDAGHGRIRSLLHRLEV